MEVLQGAPSAVVVLGGLSLPGCEKPRHHEDPKQIIHGRNPQRTGFKALENLVGMT